MRKLFKALTSVKLALVLISYLAVSGVIASLAKGPSGFYSSLFFLIPAFLFFANLAACSAERFARELKKGKAGRHGPDILHFGLILLFIGAVLGQAAKQSHPAWQGFARLGTGDAVELPDGRILSLNSLRSEKYADGRPKEWTSTVEVSKAGAILIPSYDIRVNHPLRMGPESIFQVSYGSDRVLDLTGPMNGTRSLAAGEYLDTGDGRVLLMSVDLDSGLAIARLEKGGESKTISLKTGSKVGDYTVAGAREVELSGLQAAYDPFYPLVLAAFAIIALGAFLTFARKIGDLKA